ncbi:hypothetical protein DEO72_LG3g1764 [Vigna unguiculata]|uniref:Uncharacterized protein n=1 Tax=Vigna unguiculata TaxID=3917 RepID=A0A4D6LFF2_VIGUN|nr:hypothetical protein DEO72_LG3g1764 [Vigna unguiculata]
MLGSDSYEMKIFGFMLGSRMNDIADVMRGKVDIGWLEKLCWVREEPGQNPVFHAPPGGTERGASPQAVGSKSVVVATVCRRRLAAALCPPGGDGAVWLLFGRWRLAARVWPPGD